MIIVLDYSIKLSTSNESVVFKVKQEVEEKQEILRFFFEFFKDTEKKLKKNVLVKGDMDVLGKNKVFCFEARETLALNESLLEAIFKFLKDHNFEFLQKVFRLEFNLEPNTKDEIEEKKFEEETGEIKRAFEDRDQTCAEKC